jgi:hypothetical protein
MRAAPACQVSLRRFGAWQAALWLLAGLGVATVAAWLLTREVPTLSPSSLAVASAALVLAALGASLARTRAVVLRWSGRDWQLGPASGDPQSGELDVAIDLGPWMLLRFTPTEPLRRRPRTIWLPIQRRGLEPQWHALRCAVYSPRPAPTEDGPASF